MTKQSSPSTAVASDRRQFLRTAGAAVGAAAAYSAPRPTIMAQQAQGANERIGVGFIGVGGRCQSHIGLSSSWPRSWRRRP